MENTKPQCKLIGTDGNIFALAGKACAALRKANMAAQAKELQHKLFSSPSYEAALCLIAEYVDIE